MEAQNHDPLISPLQPPSNREPPGTTTWHPNATPATQIMSKHARTLLASPGCASALPGDIGNDRVQNCRLSAFTSIAARNISLHMASQLSQLANMWKLNMPLCSMQIEILLEIGSRSRRAAGTYLIQYTVQVLYHYSKGALPTSHSCKKKPQTEQQMQAFSLSRISDSSVAVVAVWFWTRVNWFWTQTEPLVRFKDGSVWPKVALVQFKFGLYPEYWTGSEPVQSRTEPSINLEACAHWTCNFRVIPGVKCPSITIQVLSKAGK